MAATYFGPFRATEQKTSQTGPTTHQKSVNVRLVTDDLLADATWLCINEIFHHISQNHQPALIRTQKKHMAVCRCQTNTWPAALDPDPGAMLFLGHSTPSSGRNENLFVGVGSKNRWSFVEVDTTDSNNS